MRRRKKRSPSVLDSPGSRAVRPDFSMFDGKRVAVSLPIAAQRRILTGTASFKCDPLLGNVLRVTLDGDADAGHAQMLLSEASWEGRIIPDVEFGCEYLFIV